MGHTVISWNVEGNCENEAYDIRNNNTGNSFSVIFDKNGSINILTNEKLIMSEKLCAINAYQADNFKDRDEVQISD